MVTQARPMHVPAGLPIDEATRPELIDTGRANVQNRNVRMFETGSLEKRLGFSSLSTEKRFGGNITAGRKLIESPTNALGLIDSERLWTNTVDGWVDSGRVPEATYSLAPVMTPISYGYVYDSAVLNGMLAVTSGTEYGGNYLATVTDVETGAMISPPVLLDDTETGLAFVTTCGGLFIAVANYDGGLRFWQFDTTFPDQGWVSLGDIIPVVDIVVFSVCSLGDRIAVAYVLGSGSDQISVMTFDGTDILATGTVNTLSGQPTGLSVDGISGDTVWVAYIFGTSCRVGALDATTLAVVGAPTTVTGAGSGASLYVGVCAGPSRTGRVWCSGVNGDDLQLGISGLAVSSGLAVGTQPFQVLIHNVHPASRPFYRNGRYYTVLSAGSLAGVDANTQGLAFLVDFTDGGETSVGSLVRPVVNVEPGLIFGHSVFSKVNVVDTNRLLYVTQTLKAGSRDPFASLTPGASGVTGVMFDFEDRDRWSSAAHGAVNAIGGGVATTWDGARVVELGFLARPAKPLTTNAGTGITGSYRYVAVYEDVDAAGNITVSGISEPSAAATVTNKTITVKARPISVTTRVRNEDEIQSVQLALYRTTANGEPPYYRLAAIPAYPSVALVTYDDTTDDTSLTTRRKLYAPQLPGTVGEALDRRAPPQLLFPVSYAGMLVGAKGSSLFWSGQEVYGEATWFSPVFELPISGGGDITGLVVQDGSLIVFKRDRIFVVAGASPSDNGAQGGLGEARLVCSEWGCIDSNSIVATQLGVLFQSERGLEVFTRALSVEWAGEPVVDTMTTYPVVTSAVVDARNGLVRVALATSVTDGVVDLPSDADDGPGVDISGGGAEVVFDLRAKCWISVDQRESLEASQHAAYVDADGRRYAWLGSDGVIHVERDRGSAKECRDEDAWVVSQYTPAWWRLGLQQEQRIFEMVPLYQRHSSAGITVEVAEDYGAFGAVTDDKVWTADFLDARLAATQISLRPRERGFAAQLRLRDTEGNDPEDSGRGITWIGISTDIGPKQGPTRGTPLFADEMRR